MKLIKYLIVNSEDGKWTWNPELEHHSIAVPKMLNSLEDRINILINELNETIRYGMLNKINNRNKYSYKLFDKIFDVKEEISLDLYILKNFQGKVFKHVESEKGSPLMSLKQMDSPELLRDFRKQYSSSNSFSSHNSPDSFSSPNSPDSFSSPNSPNSFSTPNSPDSLKSVNTSSSSPNNIVSPLGKKKKSLISHMYDRYDNEEIAEKINSKLLEMENLIYQLDLVKECWDEMANLNELDATILISEMKKIRNRLDLIPENIFDSFFVFDDAIRGLIRNGITIKINLLDVSNKITDYIFRNILKNVNNYNKNEDVFLIDKAVERLNEFRLDVDDLNIQVLLDAKRDLETEPLANYSYEKCFKKIGELHANLKQKFFQIEGLKYIQKYLPLTLGTTIIINREKMKNILQKFCENDEVNFLDNKDLKNRSLKELENYSCVLEDYLLECEIGKEYFNISDKLRKVNSLIASKYHIYDEEKMYNSLKMIGSNDFRKFILSCKILMFELRQELKEERDVSEKDLHLVGITTGKTTMIKTFHQAVEEILASLGTFMGNTMHSLIKEMLVNFPGFSVSEKIIRESVKETYKEAEIALREFNQDSSESGSKSYSSELVYESEDIYDTEEKRKSIGYETSSTESEGYISNTFPTSEESL